MSRRPAVMPPPVCAPTGDLRPWVDDRLHTCTLCAEIVTMRALADGSDWIAVDANGQAMGRRPEPELCPCYPPDSTLRTRGGRIVNENRGPDVEIDEKSRHYGAGLWLTEFMSLHTHNGLGGEVYFTRLGGLPMACGHRLPLYPETAWAEPLATDRTPPECCGAPMRFAPRGWNCRVDTRTWIVPHFTEESADAH